MTNMLVHNCTHSYANSIEDDISFVSQESCDNDDLEEEFQKANIAMQAITRHASLNSSQGKQNKELVLEETHQQEIPVVSHNLKASSDEKGARQKQEMRQRAYELVEERRCQWPHA